MRANRKAVKAAEVNEDIALDDLRAAQAADVTEDIALDGLRADREAVQELAAKEGETLENASEVLQAVRKDVELAAEVVDTVAAAGENVDAVFEAAAEKSRADCDVGAAVVRVDEPGPARQKRGGRKHHLPPHVLAAIARGEEPPPPPPRPAAEAKVGALWTWPMCQLKLQLVATLSM